MSKDTNSVFWNKYFLEHFSKYLGKITSSKLYQDSHNKNSPPIEIVTFDNVFGGCKAFCSIGFSSYNHIVGEYSEVFMPVDAGWSETSKILSGVLFYIIQENKKIGRGLSIRFADVFPDLVDRIGKSAIFFTIPYDVPDGFKGFLYNSHLAFIYLAFYITEAEHQFFVIHGTEKFEDLLEKERVDVFNISRLSTI